MSAAIRGITEATPTNSPTSPASTQVGDVVVVIHFTRGAAGVPTHTLQSGNGFVQIRSHSHDDGSTDGRLSVAYKIATASGANAYNAYTSSTGTDFAGIIVLEGATTNKNLVGDVNNSVTATGTGVPNPPAVTTLQADCLVLTIAAWHLSSAAVVTATYPANYSGQWQITTSQTAELACATRVIAAAGAEDPGTFGDNVTPNGTCSMTIAFRPPTSPITGQINAVAALPTGTLRGKGTLSGTIGAVASLSGTLEGLIAGDVTLDAVSSNEAVSGTQLTISHATGVHPNRAMVVEVAYGGAGDVTGVTYHGAALSFIAKVTDIGRRSEMWGMAGPDEGTWDVVVNFASDAFDGMSIGVKTFYNVDQTNPFGTPNTAEANPSQFPSVTVDSASGDLVTDVVSRYNATASADSPQVKRWERPVTQPSLDHCSGSGSTKAGATSVTMSWTLGESTQWSLIAVSVKKAASGGGEAVYDNKSSTYVDFSTLAEVSHNIGASADGIFVFVGMRESESALSGVTCGGTAMEKHGELVSVSRNVRIEVWKLVGDLPSGATNIAASRPTAGSFILCVVSAIGVNQTTPLGTLFTANNFGTSASVAVNSQSGELVVDFLKTTSGITFTVGADQTSLWELSNAISGCGSSEAGAATNTMSWTLSSDSDWGMVGVAIKAAAGSPNSPITGTIDAATTVAGTLSGIGKLSGAIVSVSTTSGTMIGKVGISGSISTTSTLSGTLTGRGKAQGAIDAVSTTSGAIKGWGKLSSSIVAQASLSATLIGRVGITGSIGAASTVNATLIGKGKLSASLDPASDATGTLVGKGKVSGSIVAVCVLNGELRAASDSRLWGDIASVSTFAGTLKGKGALLSSISAASTLSGTLIGRKPITGEISIVSASSGTLIGRGRLFGVVASTATASGQISGKGSLVGLVQSSSTITGSVNGRGKLLGQAIAASTVSGSVKGYGKLSSAIVATSTTQGVLRGKGKLSATLAAQATLFGDLRAQLSVGQMTGVMSVASMLSATIHGKGALAGLVASTSEVSGSVRGTGKLHGDILAASYNFGTLKGYGFLSGLLQAVSDVRGLLGVPMSGLKGPLRIDTGSKTVGAKFKPSGSFSQPGSKSTRVSGEKKRYATTKPSSTKVST